VVDPTAAVAPMAAAVATGAGIAKSSA